MTQNTPTPNVDVQRAAMKKLDFLVGEWCGHVTAARGPGVGVELDLTEVAQYKLEGLVLTIEGIGRTKADRSAVLQAFGAISFDDMTGSYRMRAYNDGRWLDTEVTLLDGGNGLRWGFSLGEIRTHSVLRINENGEWTERAEIAIGARPPQPLLDLVARRTSTR